MSPRGVVSMCWMLLMMWLLVGIAFTLVGLVTVANIMAVIAIPGVLVLTWQESKHPPGGDDQW